MNTTNSLRWRARVTKEAFLHDDNDNSNYTDRWETDSHTTSSSTANNKHAPRRRRITTIMIDSLALGAVGATVYVILQWSLMGLHNTTHFLVRLILATACSLTLVLASIVMHQERKQRRLGMLRQVYFATKRTVRSLQQQNERLCRSLTALDRTVDRMHVMEQELRQYTQSTDAAKSIQVVQEYMQIQRRLKEQLLYQVQEQILVAVLQRASTSNNVQLSATDMERLLVQLNNMKGVVVVQEATAREILISHEHEEEGFTIPLENVLSLLRHLRKDAHPKTDRLTPTSSRGGIWLDDDTSNTTLFQFQPRVLLPSSKDLMEF